MHKDRPTIDTIINKNICQCKDNESTEDVSITPPQMHCVSFLRQTVGSAPLNYDKTN
jgi:hypothetical protein